MGLVRYWADRAGALQLMGDIAPQLPPPPPPPPPGSVRTQRSTRWAVLSTSGGGGGTGKMWLVGLGRSTQGLNAADSVKRADTLERFAQMASRLGITAAEMRSRGMWHQFNGGINWNAENISNITWCVANGFKGMVYNQHCAGGGSNYAAWARGDLDANFRSYLQSIVRVRTKGFKFVVVMEHEPENNTGFKDQASASLWAQGTARFMKITYEFADPDIIYSTCYIPAASGTNRNWWNPRPHLNTLMGSTAAAQKVMDATLCGLDPYPIIRQDDTTQHLSDICSAALTDYRAWGFTRFSMPETGFFNWNDKLNRIGPLTAMQQAKRLYDDLWTWAKAQGFEVITYFDFTDVNNARGDSRTLETAEEQTVYGHIISNNATWPL